MSCWICREECENICCDCNGEFKYGHNYCVGVYSILNYKKKCRFCDKNYKVNILYIIFFYFILLVKRLFDFRYYQGKKWLDDEYYSDNE